MSESIVDIIAYLLKRPIIPAHLPGPSEDSSSLLPNPENVQGDVYLTLPKKFEHFLFFNISDAAQFRVDLFTYLPDITSSAETAQRIHLITKKKKGEDLDFPSSNIAFSRTGLDTLGIGKLNDPLFDESAPITKPHGVILVTAKTEKTCEDLLNKILSIFRGSISVLDVIAGHEREGGREFFGWRDGISQPALDGLTNPNPGQLVVEPGVIILGYPGDPLYGKRPAFTKDGSFLVYSKLEQDVWLFNRYVESNWEKYIPANPAEGYCLTDAQRKSLFCARLFGRFKSGVPLALSPYIDDHTFLSDGLINYFNFAERKPTTGCPLFSHILKTNPRSINLQDVPEDVIKASVIVRAGIPYGPEFSAEELQAFETLQEDKKVLPPSGRGLLFVCYQTSISNGFLRQLNVWARNDGFPPSFGPVGQDPIIGHPQSVWPGGKAQAGSTGGLLPPPPDYVRQLDGGIYFTPSISTVTEWAKPN